ncbi:hypothetical protein E2C01_052638 [Portunus trituberculatus]|uniref:Uncharacterized protein n=1 Tax=Portunus trituberculatus TaxID=210409 RepID=A0A5B7GF72_PORTR|nr:hypothetical protein [Portunus trituberculatus]
MEAGMKWVKYLKVKNARSVSVF